MSYPSPLIQQLDVTQSLELLLDVRVLNEGIGIMKDASNATVVVPVASYYDTSNALFYIDQVTVDAADLASATLVSTGAYASLYRDFIVYVSAYFGVDAAAVQPVGFSTLFGVLSALSSMDLDVSSTVLSGVSGGCTIGTITSVLDAMVYYDPFGNRDASHTVLDGFLADDLVYTEVQVTLSVAVQNEAFPSPMNNAGNRLSAATGASQDAAFGNGAGAGTLIMHSTSTTTLISRVVQTPLLLRMV